MTAGGCGTILLTGASGFVGRHVAAGKKFVEAGFDHVIPLQGGPDQESFFRAFEQELAPELRKLQA